MGSYLCSCAEGYTLVEGNRCHATGTHVFEYIRAVIFSVDILPLKMCVGSLIETENSVNLLTVD